MSDMRVYLAKAVGGTYTSVQGLRGQVDALEAELGVKLFSRTNKGLNPTVTGGAVRARCPADGKAYGALPT